MADTVKHTKGPWLVRPHWNDEARFEVFPDREVEFGSPAEIADVCAHSADDFDKEVAEAKANANLIAAAPDLLEALGDFASMKCETAGVEDLEGGCCRTCRARAAIAKATGGQ